MSDLNKIAQQFRNGLKDLSNNAMLKEKVPVMPVNPINNQKFQGINSTMLMNSGFHDPRFLGQNHALKFGLKLKEGEAEKGIDLLSWRTKDQNGNKLETPNLIVRTFYNIDQFTNADQLKAETEKLTQKPNPITRENFDQFAYKLFEKENALEVLQNVNNINNNDSEYMSSVIDAYSLVKTSQMKNSANAPEAAQDPMLINSLAQELNTRIHAVCGLDKKTDNISKSIYVNGLSQENVLSNNDEQVVKLYSKALATVDKITTRANDLKESIDANLSNNELLIFNTIKQAANNAGIEKDVDIGALRYSDNNVDIMVSSSELKRCWTFEVIDEEVKEFYEFTDDSSFQEKEETRISINNANREKYLETCVNTVISEIQTQTAKVFVDTNNPNDEFSNIIAKAKELGAKWDKQNKSWYVLGAQENKFKEEWNKYLASTPTKDLSTSLPTDNAKIYLDVPYQNRNQAKELGAKWDRNAQSWYTDKQNPNLNSLSAIFKKRSPESTQERINNITVNSLNQPKEPEKETPKKNNNSEFMEKKMLETIKQGNPIQFKPTIKEDLKKQLEDGQKVYVNISTEERGEAFQAGLKFDSSNKLWFAPPSTDDQKANDNTIDVITSMNWETITEQDLVEYKQELKSLYDEAKEQVESTTTTQQAKTFLDVPFAEKDEAKELGARWDSKNSSWYIDSNNPNKDLLTQKYGEKSNETVSKEVLEKENSRTYLNVPKVRKDEAKELGAKWDRNKGQWFSEKQNPNLDKLIEKFTAQKINDVNVIDAPDAQLTPSNEDTKIYLEVPFSKKDEAKKLGANWDKNAESWYSLSSNPNIEELKASFTEISKDDVQKQYVEKRNERVYLNVPRSEKDEAKELGARWDRAKSQWYSHANNENLETLKEKWSVKETPEQAPPQNPINNESRTYLYVPFDDKDEAKTEGIKWDNARTQWYWDNQKGDLPVSLEKYLDEPAQETQTTEHPLERFKDVLEERGFIVSSSAVLIADGRPHRLPVEGDTGNKESGYYTLHDNGGMYVGLHHNFKDNQGEQKWLSGASNAEEYSPEEILEIKRKVEQNRKEMLIEIAKKAETMAKRAEMLLNNPQIQPTITPTPYMENKGISIKPNTLTATDKPIMIPAYSSKGGEYSYRVEKDDLLIPLMNTEGKVVSLQNIKPNGDKYNLGGGEKNGSFHIVDGDIKDLSKVDVIFVTEGYATGATISEVAKENKINSHTIVALDSNNLVPVVKNLKELNPNIPIIIAADNDEKNLYKNPPKPNSGIEKANEAAKDFADVTVMFPEFKVSTEGMDLSKMLSDFNDQATQVENGRAQVAQKMKNNVERLQKVKNKIQEVKIEKNEDQKQDTKLSQSPEEQQQPTQTKKKSAGRKL